MAKRHEGKQTKLPPGVTPMTEDERLIYDTVMDRVTAFNAHRRSRLITIKANISYLCGEQNIVVRNETISKASPEESTSVVCNLILPAVVNDIATGTKVPASFDIVPSSTGETDRATAEACNMLMPYLLRVNDRNLHRSSVILWYDLDGVGWRKVYWDPAYALQGMDEQGQPVLRGEAVVEPVPNNELIFDHRAKNLDKLDWIIHNKRVSMAWVRRNYGDETAGKVQVYAKRYQDDEFELEIASGFHAIQESIAPSHVTPGESGATDDLMLDYYEYWHKPCTYLPTGAYVVILGERLVVNQPYPAEQYPHSELPFVPCAPIPLTGLTVGSIPRISQARPLQREYNRLRSIIMENVDVMSNSVLMKHVNTKVNPKKLSNRAGNIIEWEGSYPPTREPGLSPPSQLFMHLTVVKQNIDEIFAFHEPTKGQMPSGGPKSARGLEVLQMADYSQLGPIIEAMETADEHVVYQLLTLAIANYQERVIEIIGPDHQWTTYRLDQDKLRGKVSVIVRRGSSTPTNKEIEANRTFAIWQSGLFGDPNSPAVRLFALKQMNLGNADSILKVNAKQVNFARNEFHWAEAALDNLPDLPEGMSDQQVMEYLAGSIFVPQPQIFDDHIVHADEHKLYLVDNYWRLMNHQHPGSKYLLNMLLQHYMVHEQTLQQGQIQATQAAMQQEAFIRGNTMDQIVAKKVNFDSDDKKTDKTD